MKLIWEGTDYRVKPKVFQRPDGGLIFRYFAPYHSRADLACEFTLWCEVGERYRPYFADFWVGRELSDEPVKIDRRPYLFDRLK